MFKRILAAVAASCLPVLGMASVQTNHFSASCSNQLTISGGAGMQWVCSGDLLLSGFEGMGSINADDTIDLRATGKLTLDNLTLTAPSIKLAANDLQILGTTVLSSPHIDLTSYGPLVVDGHVNVPSADTLNLNAIVAAASRDPALFNLLRTLSSGGGSGAGSGTGGAIQISGGGNVSLTPQGIDPLTPAVPEPASWGLVAIGLLAMSAYSRRQA